MIRFKCANCGQALSVKDEAAGKRVKCKVCAEAVEVPSAPPPKPRATPEPEEEVDDAPPVPARGRRLPPRVLRGSGGSEKSRVAIDPGPIMGLLSRFGPITATLVAAVVLFFKAKGDPQFAGALGPMSFLVGGGLVVVSYLWGLSIACHEEGIGVGMIYYLLPLGRRFGMSQGIRLVLEYREIMTGPGRLFWIGFLILLLGGAASLTQVNFK